jgi:hypothetical protein
MAFGVAWVALTGVDVLVSCAYRSKKGTLPALDED